MHYVIITPVRDEKTYVEKTLQSVLAQTIRPVEWVLVNDGSTDGTGTVIDEYAASFPWIHAVHREDRGFRKAGGGVVEAFNEGYRALRCRDWEFIVKLDGDLSFPPNYFERCIEHFRQETRLGIGGGIICQEVDGTTVVERTPAFHVRGATKIYRRACWDEIGGLWPAPGWDTLDEVKASRLGWTTRSFPELQLIHHRPTGTAEGRWAGLLKDGRADYICGYHPLFMLVKCVVRLARKPYFVASAGLLFGFITGYLKRIPQVDDPETIRYLRRQQVNRLLGAESIWR